MSGGIWKGNLERKATIVGYAYVALALIMEHVLLVFSYRTKFEAQFERRIESRDETEFTNNAVVD